MTKEELEKDFYKYLKDSSDYYDPREPLTERKLLQIWLDCAEPREKRIDDLEKENAELKDKVEMYDFFYEGNGFKRRGLNNSIQIAEYIKKLELRLSYAKETIEGLMRFCRCFAQHHTEDIRYKEAEQFLSEVEK